MGSWTGWTTRKSLVTNLTSSVELFKFFEFYCRFYQTLKQLYQLLILWKHFTKISSGLYIRVYNAHFINVSLLWNMVFTSKVSCKKGLSKLLTSSALGLQEYSKDIIFSVIIIYLEYCILFTSSHTSLIFLRSSFDLVWNSV